MGLLDNAKKEMDRMDNKIPDYKKDGTSKSIIKTFFAIIGVLIILIAISIAAVHVPALLYKPVIVAKKNTMHIKPVESGIKYMLDYVKDKPNEDFDSDGLKNSEELTYNTDPRNPDSDLDGLSDYAEIYQFNTRPNVTDNNIITYVKGKLDENNINVNAPYKIHDIVMWADEITSRSLGTVIPTLKGYRFSRFNGWAQFPGTVYAYKVEDGLHIPLEYKKNENAWKIESLYADEEIALYAQPLETCYILTVFDRKYIVDEGTLADIFNVVLPKEHSFITFTTIVSQDSLPAETTATITGTTMPEYNKTDMSRFGECTNSLDELSAVFTSIMSGKPVVVSLQSPSYGEVVCLAYGYTNEYGDLLLADENGNTTDDSGNPYLLDIIEKSAITIDQNGILRQREYFDFFGMGFDSTKGDKIHFIMQKK